MATLPALSAYAGSAYNCGAAPPAASLDLELAEGDTLKSFWVSRYALSLVLRD
jgi:hypothetical protein